MKYHQTIPFPIAPSHPSFYNTSYVFLDFSNHVGMFHRLYYGIWGIWWEVYGLKDGGYTLIKELPLNIEEETLEVEEAYLEKDEQAISVKEMRKII